MRTLLYCNGPWGQPALVVRPGHIDSLQIGFTEPRHEPVRM